MKSVLKDKLPEGQLACQEVLLPSVDSSKSFSVIFDSLDASVIRRAALNTKGTAGPSGLVGGGSVLLSERNLMTFVTHCP